MLIPPRFEPADAYGERLGDTNYWLPYARAALHRAGLADEPLSTGFTGTYPTLVGPTVVVKLFGHFPGWQESYISELNANRVVAESGGIDAPRVIASGRLFGRLADDWPYLIFETLPGQAWRDAELTDGQRRRIARVLGEQLSRLHTVSLGRPVDLQPDWIATQGAGAAERQRCWGSLPGRLIDQIDDYLADYRPDAVCLVHGDVTEDHVFVVDGAYTGLIDWGDAMTTDPFYELGALFFGTFAADRSVLAEYLDGYRMPVDDRFVRRAMQVALMHRFDMFGGVAQIAAIAADLDELAERLWRP